VATTVDTRGINKNRKNILILFFLFIAIIVWYALGTMPLTSHATESHANEAINAGAVVSAVTAGACRKIEVYDCPDEGTIKVLCKMGDKVWGGLIIGIDLQGNHKIITGYGARKSYWDNNVDGCRYMGGALAVP
jgi:uncharacterized protein (UPF0333 family)